MTGMKLTEIAERIKDHLRRLEADPKANAQRFYVSARDGKRHSSGRPFYGAGARRAGARVAVTYVAYQGTSKLTRDEALTYLAWLDAGGKGTHYQAKRQATS